MISNQPTTITSGIQLVASTATADSDSLKKGDIAITMGPLLREKLSAFAKEAVATCIWLGGAKGRKLGH
jgi:hypothetical protein